MRPSYWSGNESRRTDLLIVGAGFAGLTSALACRAGRPGARITLIDRYGPGAGASGRNGGMVIPFPLIPLWLLPRSIPGGFAGRANARLMEQLEAVLEGVVGEVVMPEQAEIVLAAKSWFWSQGLKWVLGRAEALGIGVERLDEAELRSRYASTMPLGIRYAGYGIQPWEAARRLAAEAERQGVEIVRGVEALEMEAGGDGLVRVRTDSGDIAARQVLVATNAYGNGLAGMKPGIMVFSYVLATAPLSAQQCRELGGEQGLYSELDTGVYRRVHDGRLVFGALDKVRREVTEGHATDAGAQRELRTLLADSLPAYADVPIEREWGGAFCQRLGAPLVRPHASIPGVYLNTGYGGSGVALSLLSGALVPGMLWPECDSEVAAAIRAEYAETRVPWLSLPGMAFAAIGAH